MSFIIDGVTYDVACTIERVAEVKPSEISGLLLDRSYFNDVVGTFFRYDVTLAVKMQRNGSIADEDVYYKLYKQLTEAVDGHQLVMPYTSGTIEVTARIDQVKDALVRLPGSAEFWEGFQFTATANNPTHAATLYGTITRGLAPLPQEGSANVGDLYEYTSSGWVEVSYSNADNIAY